MEYFKIGKLAASHGLKGDIILQHSLGKKTLLKDVQAIFLEQPKDNFLPHFIEKVTGKTDTELYLKLEGIDTKEAARLLTPKEVWLQEEDFNKHRENAAPIALLGFDVMDKNVNLGPIIEVIEMPHQLLCTIMYKGKEALIPVHEANLIKMDSKNKKVHLEIPDGLLEIYE